MQRERKRPNLQGAHVLDFLVRLEEHAVGDHGEEEKRHAAADSLNASEAALRRTRHDGEPEMIVGELLAD